MRVRKVQAIGEAVVFDGTYESFGALRALVDPLDIRFVESPWGAEVVVESETMGRLRVQPGDWLIVEPPNRLVPVTGAQFPLMYEPAPEGEC